MAQLTVGAELGPYKIEGHLGSGGMGEVFRGLDTRLGRRVAIKVSQEQFAPRVEREARAIAQLNHPHICTLYDVGPDYLVMELVEGETLADRLRGGRLEISQVLAYGGQIADALAAAHAKGIIHRDLKPQNIMLTKSGVKVLDFGLAKATRDETLTGTREVVGTPAYMAPEQREGRSTDERSDVYALGLVLLEMATGERPLPGVAQSREGLPLQTAQIIDRCLARDPDERWQSARDVMGVLKLVSGPSPSASGGPSTGKGSLRRLAVPTAAALALLVAVDVGYRVWPTPDNKPFKFSILPPEGTTFVGVSSAGAPAVSPDGRLVAFVAQGPADRLLWVRSLDGFDARPLRGTEGASYPFWSADSQWLGFYGRGSLKKVDLAGGQSQVLARGGSSGGTWSHEGKILFAPTNITLFVVSASGGEAAEATRQDVTRLEENHLFPFFLPDDRHYLLQVRGGPELTRQVWVGELGSNQRQLLLDGMTNAQYATSRAGGDGHLLFARASTLMAQRFDIDHLALAGSPVVMAENVAVAASGGLADFSVSPSGVLAYRVADPGKQELVWYDRTGNQVGAIGDRPGNPRNNLRLSPDGKSVAFTRQGEASQDVWIHDFTRGVASRFTFGGGRSPVWSPDGSQIAFLRKDTIYRKSVMGGGPEVALWTGERLLSLNDWSGDGRYLLFTRWDLTHDRGLWLLPDPLTDTAKHEPTLLESPALHGQFAPATGAPRWVSYDAEEARVRQVFVRTMPGGPPGRWQVSIDGGNGARWRRDGRELYFASGPSFVAVEVDGAAPFRASAPRPLCPTPRGIQTAIGQYAPGYDVSPDGQRFLSTFTVPESLPTSITVVMNWHSTLRK